MTMPVLRLACLAATLGAAILCGASLATGAERSFDAGRIRVLVGQPGGGH